MITFSMLSKFFRRIDEMFSCMIFFGHFELYMEQNLSSTIMLLALYNLCQRPSTFSF